MKVKNVTKEMLLLLVLILMCIRCDSVKAATTQEANSDTYNWYTNFQDGTGNHYMQNLPVTDWKSSAPAWNTTGGTKVWYKGITQDKRPLAVFDNLIYTRQ